MKCLPREFLKTFNKSEDFITSKMLESLDIKDGDTICQPFATTTHLVQVNKRDVANVCLNTTYFPLAALLLVVRDDVNLIKSETYGYHLGDIDGVRRHYDTLSKNVIESAKRMKPYYSPDDVKMLGVYYYLLNRKSLFNSESLTITEDGQMYNKFNTYKTHLLDKVCSGKELDGLHKSMNDYNVIISDLHWKSYCFNVLGSKKNRAKWLFTLPDFEENSRMSKHDSFFKFGEEDFHELMTEVIPIIEGRQENYLVMGSYNDRDKLDIYLEKYSFSGKNNQYQNRRQKLEIDEAKKLYIIRPK